MFVEKREIVEKQKMHDKTIAVSWNKNDYDYVNNHYALLRQLKQSGKLEEMNKTVEDFEALVNRRFNDQTAINPKTNKRIEPIEQTEKDDLITHGGKQLICEYLAQTTLNFFYWMNVGTSQQPVDESDDQLYAEIFRDSILDKGIIAGGQSVLKFSMIFPPDMESTATTGDIYEVGIVNTAAIDADQVQGTRSIFPATKPIKHVYLQDFFNITVNLYFTGADIDDEAGQFLVTTDEGIVV